MTSFFCLFFKRYPVAPYIFWVLVGHIKPSINLDSVFLLPCSLLSKWSEGMPLSACPMDGKDFQAPGLVNTEPLANTKLQKDDDKQTSCQSSLPADRFSLGPPSSSLVLLCFRTKIPKYLRKKGLLGRIDPLCLHCSSSCFPVSKPIWVHPSAWAEEEKRTGRDLLCCLMGKWGWSCSSTLPWVSSLDQRRNPRSDQKTGPGWRLLESNEEQPWLEVTNYSQNLQHSGFDQIKPREAWPICY